MNEITKQVITTRLNYLLVDYDALAISITRVEKERNILMDRFNNIKDEINKLQEDLDNGNK